MRFEVLLTLVLVAVVIRAIVTLDYIDLGLLWAFVVYYNMSNQHKVPGSIFYKGNPPMTDSQVIKRAKELQDKPS